MKRPKPATCGSLKLHKKIDTPSGIIQMGFYSHPIGNVITWSRRNITKATTICPDGRELTDSRSDHPTPRQIANLCRNLLLLAQPKPPLENSS